MIRKRYLLKKFPGKGGWTYAEIPEIPMDKNTPFGWVRVKGSIDSYQFEKYHLMPLGNGKLFLPVKAEVRKKIKKQAGDYVEVMIEPDHSTIAIPAELEECLQAEPAAHSYFLGLKEGQQKEFIDWIYAARQDPTKAARIIKTIDLLLKRKTLRTGNET
jgi:hypothetical protein